MGGRARGEFVLCARLSLTGFIITARCAFTFYAKQPTGKLFQAPSKVRRHVAEFHEGKKRVGRNSGKKRKKPTSPPSGAGRLRKKKKTTPKKAASTPSAAHASSTRHRFIISSSRVSNVGGESLPPSPSSSSVSGSDDDHTGTKGLHPCPYGCGKTFARPSKAQRHADEVHDRKTRAGREDRIPCVSDIKKLARGALYHKNPF